MTAAALGVGERSLQSVAQGTRGRRCELLVRYGFGYGYGRGHGGGGYCSRPYCAGAEDTTAGLTEEEVAASSLGACRCPQEASPRGLADEVAAEGSALSLVPWRAVVAIQSVSVTDALDVSLTCLSSAQSACACLGSVPSGISTSKLESNQQNCNSC